MLGTAIIKKSTAIALSGILGISLTAGACALAINIQPAFAKDAANTEALSLKERILQRSCDYSYESSTLNGTGYSINETVFFNEDGNALSTLMHITFPDAESAQQYLDGLRKDYGEQLDLIYQDAGNLVCRIDLADLELDKEEYEDALKYSVDDFTVSTDNYDSKMGSTKLETLLLSTVSFMKTA